GGDNNHIHKSPPIKNPTLNIPSKKKLLNSNTKKKLLNKNIQKFNNYKNITKQLKLTFFKSTS
ncbi:hypothetical protein, partial [Proteus mirabilis]|uniref:hypothetical protein n=1 Tax=Proteus mirabilis TaxID=584 RepID=UPI0025756018